MDKKVLFAKEWFDFGKIDLELAMKLFEENLEDKWTNIVCYHCEQGAEKFLKGLRVFNGLQNKTIHYLDELYKDCEQYIEKYEQNVCDACANLQSYAVSVRYPGYEELEYDDMRDAIQDAIIIREFVNENSGGLIDECEFSFDE